MTMDTPIVVPDHWTPQQAEACLDLLHLLADAVWDQYEQVLVPGLSGELDEMPDDAEDVGDHEASRDRPF